MSSSVRGAVIIVALALPFAAAARQTSPGSSDDEGRLAVGFSCSDGSFTPLAARSSGAWRPLVQDQEDLPGFFAALTPEALRLPRQGWSFYPAGAPSPIPLALGTARRNDIAGGSRCTEAGAYDAPALATPQQPKGGRSVTGYGILGPARFEVPEDVTGQPDDDSRQVAQRVVQEIHAAERRLVRRTIQAGGRSHLAAFSGRPNVRSTGRLLEMKRDRALDSDWYFFQAHKQHGEWYTVEGKRTYKLWATVLVHGWVHVSDRLSPFLVQASLEDDAGKAFERYAVAGVIRLGDRDAWLTRVSGYERTNYRIFEIGPGAAPPRRVFEVLTHGA